LHIYNQHGSFILTKSEQQLHFPLRNLPDSERPRERLFQFGATQLSNTELIAIILGSGSQKENVVHLSERILAMFGGLKQLSQATIAELESINGLGEAKISRIIATIELSHRFANTTTEQRPFVKSSADAANLVLDMGRLPQEHIRTILLDSAFRVIAIPTIYIGTVNAAILRTSEIFKEAIVRNAPSIILAHNHPSGDPSPSPEDVELTKQIIKAGVILDIAVLDHIIIVEDGWRSLKDLGLAFYDRSNSIT
jgi:DNA repair protein RadC